MYVDASVMVAILVHEPDATLLIDRMADTELRQTSVISALEAVMAVGRKTGNREAAAGVVRDFLTRSEITVWEADDSLLEELAEAHLRYGKGSGHPARLNLGDCFSYAMAKRNGVPLLYKGRDFALTDLA